MFFPNIICPVMNAPVAADLSFEKTKKKFSTTTFKTEAI